MTPSELTNAVLKALEQERSVDEVAQKVGAPRSSVLDIMLYLAGRGRIVLTDSLHSKWQIKHGRETE
ncbi:hypothetical protein PED39_05390 [Methanomassiliicoccales archaeon LGM-RCC1]|nr:hypothetical protein PED39_05390 [Methanomassiliicoccales archaeon LGM-RCC1]